MIELLEAAASGPLMRYQWTVVFLLAAVVVELGLVVAAIV